MAKVTDFSCTDELGKNISCDAFGINVALGCPKCGYPILAIALEHQHGFSENNPAVCRSCNLKCWISVREAGALCLHVAALAPASEASLPVLATLVDFIETNQRIITVLGVFAALTVLAGNMRAEGFGQLLSLLFLAQVLLVWFELWGRFPSRGTLQLSWFENLMALTIIILVGYWILVVRVHTHTLISILVFLLMLTGAAKIVKHYDLFNKVFRTAPNRRKGLRYLLGLSLQLLVFALAFSIAIRIGPPLDRFIDKLASEFVSKQK